MTIERHTVIYTHGGGRLGNQIIRWAHWMAWVSEHPGDVEVLDLAFWAYADYFATWHGNPACIFPIRPHALDSLARLRRRLPEWWRPRLDWRVQRGVHALGRGWPGWQAVSLDDEAGESIDLEKPEFLAQVEPWRVTTCAGWKIAGWNLFAKRQTLLRELFRPAPAVARRAADFMAPLRAAHDVIVGVFIRHGDYRGWNDGEFFFPPSAYAGWMRQLLDLHGGRRLAFVIASDERQPPEAFSGLPCHFASGSVNEGGPWFESFAELALCDVVLSPPSTFAAAAAFVGGASLWPVCAAGQTLAFHQVLPDAMVDAARHPQFSRAVK